MNNGGHMRPPFIGAPVPNMTTAVTPQPVQVQHQQQPTSPFNLNVPPPNFSIPPPTSTNPFPRFSGPIHNQPTFYPGNTNTAAVSVPLPTPHIPGMNQSMAPLPPVYNTFNTSGVAANLNQGGSVPRFNHGTVAGHWSSCMTAGNSNVQRHPYPNHHNQQQSQRQLPNLSNDIFSDAPKEPTGSFPHFKPPTMPPPSSGTVAALQLQNPISPSSPQTMMQQMHQQQGRGGMNNNRGGGYRQGNNSFGNFNNNNMDRGNRNNGNFNNNNNSNYNNNKRGRGGFFNNRGKGGNFHHNNNSSNNNNNHHNNNNNNNHHNNNKGRGGNKNRNGHQGGVDNKNEPKAPEDFAFNCDTCDRGFKTEEKFLEHVSQHEKCRYPDCPFVAAPKLVQLHMNMQHRRGLASKIYGVKSEEDIKKWKEERKKNYPTAENIKKKKERQEERIARGEVIETKEFGKMRGQNQERGSDRGRGRGRFGRDRRGGGRNSRGCDEEVVNLDNGGDDNDDDDGPPEERKIERSNKEDKREPSVDLTNGTDSDDQDRGSPSKKSKNSKDDDNNVVVDLTGEAASSSSLSSPPGKKEKKSKEQKKTAATASDDQEQDKDKNREDTSLSLLSGYGSDDSDGNSPSNKGAKGESRGHKDTTDKSTKANTTATPDCKEGSKSLVNGNDKTVDGLDNNNTVPTTTNTKEVSSNRSSEVKSSKRGHHHAANGGPPDKRQKYTPRPLPKSHTLLEKMLANEIRRERNKILQCVHFIVKNKFFDKIDGDSS